MWVLADVAPVTQQRLSGLLRVTPRYVTRLVDALEGRGLVERRSHPSDRRSLLVASTGGGDQLLSSLRTEHARLADRFFGDLRSQRRSAFHETTESVIERLSAP